MQDLVWDDFRFVLAVSRRTTLAGAADTLRVNESTVARRIARAEARLQARLFDRNGSRLVPTDAGRHLIAHAERIEREVQAAGTAIAGTDRQAVGTVRVTSVPLIVNRILVPALSGFLDRHPDLCVELIADPADLRLMHRDIDIALRFARPREEPQALARRIGNVPYGVFAATSASATADGWIAYADDMRFLPQTRWLAEQVDEGDARLAGVRVNDAEALLFAVKAGLGRGFLPLFLAAEEPDLRRVDDGRRRWSRELWMMLHPDLRDLTRIRVTADWLAATVSGRLDG